MEGFVSRKRRKIAQPTEEILTPVSLNQTVTAADGGIKDEEEDDADIDTDTKVAILASLHPELDHGILFDALIAADGSIHQASLNITDSAPPSFEALQPSMKPSVPSPTKPRTIGLQTPLPFASSAATTTTTTSSSTAQPLTRRGQTLHLYTPSSIAQHTPCSLIPNFLDPATADALLRELLAEATTFARATFKLFDNVVTSPHSACFYAPTALEAGEDTSGGGGGGGGGDSVVGGSGGGDFLYNGSRLDDVRQLTPLMRAIQARVRHAVNAEVEARIRDRYPGGRRLRFMGEREWLPNAAFVNCYDGGAESVGWHTDQLTYLGPRAVIGSISLGVAREFRVRKIVPKDEDGDGGSEGKGDEGEEGGSGNGSGSVGLGPAEAKRKHASGKGGRKQADEQGQIAIHLPHNSLLVMHAEMQEEWKHSIAPAQAIDPHPVAGNKRINITYRHYREDFNPKYTPRCKCGVATVLRCVQRTRMNRGRYMWQCHAGNAPGKQGCNFFQWAEFDDDGNPPWSMHKAQKSYTKANSEAI